MTGTTEFRGNRGGDRSGARGAVGALAGVGSRGCCIVEDDAGVEELLDVEIIGSGAREDVSD
jgi:hypothetical protein